MLEMARHPDMQMKLRKEIRETEQKLRASGRIEFSAYDFESMPYLTAVVKVRDFSHFCFYTQS